MSTEIEKAMDVLRGSMEEDYEYAWGWHCNLAMAFYDEGASHEDANKAASRFMSIAFGIDTTIGPPTYSITSNTIQIDKD